MTLKTLDGTDDPTGCAHDWLVPHAQDALAHAASDRAFDAAPWAWCQSCGCLASGAGADKVLFVSGLKQLAVWGRSQMRRRR